MAAKKKSAPRQRRSAALDNGAGAVGASLVRPEFAFAPADDLAFAVGFPYLRYLEDGHPDDAAPRASAERILLEEYPHLRITHGAATAPRVARAITLSQPFEFESNPGLPTLQPAARAALDRDDAVTPAEVAEHVRAMLSQPYAAFTITEALLLFEALVGSGAVVDAVLDALEGFQPETRWDPPKTRAVQTAGLMMLRLDAVSYERARQRLSAVRARVGEELAKYMGIVAILDGGGIEPPLPVIRADGEQVRAARVAAPQPWYAVPDPRLVFLGGDDVYRVELTLWAKYTHPIAPGIAHPLIIERFAPIRSPLTVELMVDMTARSRAKASAKAWFKEHFAFAKPVLEKLISSRHPLASTAKTVLASGE